MNNIFFSQSLRNFIFFPNITENCRNDLKKVFSQSVTVTKSNNFTVEVWYYLYLDEALSVTFNLLMILLQRKQRRANPFLVLLRVLSYQ